MPTIKVLLIDDSKIFLYAARALLATIPGVETVGTTYSPDVAKKVLADTSPDLVMMNFMMPGMGGIEAVHQICSSPNAPRVVLMTLNEAVKQRVVEIAGNSFDVIEKSDFAVEIPRILADMASCGATQRAMPLYSSRIATQAIAAQLLPSAA